MYIWIDNRIFVADNHILHTEKTSRGYVFHLEKDETCSVDGEEGRRIIALLQRDSIGQTLKIGRGQTINPLDVIKTTLYGENEEFQVIVLNLKGGGKIEVGTAWDLVGYEIVHNHFLKDRPPFSASDWAFIRESKKVKELEPIIRELWKALYDAVDTGGKMHPVLLKYFSYGKPE